MKSILSDLLWRDVRRRASSHRRLRAAIAYVTADHLMFRRGDILVCDASDTAVKAGMTAPSRLREFVAAGADVYSYAGLHSKVAVIDDCALVGSANLSAAAGVQTCEASLLTDDPQIVALTLVFIDKVKAEAVRIDQAFLHRLEQLPVTPFRPPMRRSAKKVAVGQSRLWIAATRPLSDRLINAEAGHAAAGMKKAEQYARRGYEVESLRRADKSKFRAEAKAGDLVIQAFSWRAGTRTFTEVYSPAPIVHREDGHAWTRFYLEYSPDAGVYGWRDVEKDFRSLGARDVTRNSTRELTGDAKAILELLK